MIIDLPKTTSASVSKKLVQLRNDVGAMTLGRVLTLVIVVDVVAQLHQFLAHRGRRRLRQVDDHGILQVRPSRAIIWCADAGPQPPAP